MKLKLDRKIIGCPTPRSPTSFLSSPQFEPKRNFSALRLADVRRYRLVKILFLLIRNANEQQSAFAHGIRALAGVYES
jgi:hypothetical protein